jgi:hypothetical protein
MQMRIRNAMLNPGKIECGSNSDPDPQHIFDLVPTKRLVLQEQQNTIFNSEITMHFL